MKGQTLIEVLVALAAAGVVITAITAVVTTSLSNAQYIRDQNSATNYAEQGMEIIRHLRDSDIASFRSYSGDYCLGKGQTSLGTNQSNCGINVDNFERAVSIDQSPGCAANVAKVTLTVSWTDGRCINNANCHKIPLVTCLSTNNLVPAP